MNNFKEMLEEDIGIFINIEEMGETIRIGEKEYSGVIEFPEKEFSEIQDGFSEAISLIVYVKECLDFKAYKIGKGLKINDTFYVINNTFVEEKIRVFKLIENIGA